MIPDAITAQERLEARVQILEDIILNAHQVLQASKQFFNEKNRELQALIAAREKVCLPLGAKEHEMTCFAKNQVDILRTITELQETVYDDSKLYYASISSVATKAEVALLEQRKIFKHEMRVIKLKNAATLEQHKNRIMKKVNNLLDRYFEKDDNDDK